MSHYLPFRKNYVLYKTSQKEYEYIHYLPFRKNLCALQNITKGK